MLDFYKKVSEQLERQLHNFFADIDMFEVNKKIDEAYTRCINAISASNDRYLNPSGIPRFLMDHSGCWALFLYYLSNSLKDISEDAGRERGGVWRPKFII